MVHILIRMRAAMIAHQRSSRFGLIPLVLTWSIGLLSALGTFSLGFVHYPTPAAGADVFAMVMAIWIITRVAYAAFTGGSSTLRLDMFRLLPIPYKVLARALLLVGLLDPALLFLVVAFAGLVVFGAQGGFGPALIAAAGVLLTLAFTSVLVSMVEAVMPPGSRRRRDAGTMLVAVIISLVAIVGTLLPSLIGALSHGTIPVLSAIVRALPSGWAASAVGAARTGRPALTVLPLIGLIILVGMFVRAWPALLSLRLDGTLGSAAGARSRSVHARFLPQTPTGAVMAKEIRMWVRDPLRLTFLMIAAIVGLGVCTIPEVVHGTSLLLPFAGVLTVIIAGSGGCNLYGSDGLPLRLMVMTPESEHADVRGRQLAWLLLVGPYTLCVTVTLTFISDQPWAWPWALGILAATIGGAAGLFPLMSLIAVLPLDENGGPPPAWPLKVWATIILTALSAVPALAMLIIGAVEGSLLLQWLAVPLGIFTGAACTFGLGDIARRRLVSRQFDILAHLTSSSNSI